MAAPTPGPSRHFPGNSGIRFLFVYMALFVPFAVVTPYLQALLRLRGFERDEIGLILGCFEAMAVLAPPVWGAFSDRFRHPRAVLLAAVLGCLPCFLLFGLVSRMSAAVLVVLLYGFFYRPLIPLTDGLTFRFLRTRGGDYGKVRLGGSLAFILSMVVLERLGIAGTKTGGTILLAMCAGVFIQSISVAIIPSVSTSGGSSRDHGGDSGPVRRPMERLRAGLAPLARRSFLCFTLCALLGRVAMMSYYGFFTLYLKEEHGFEQVGYIWLIGPLSELPVMYYSRRIMDRIGVKSLFALGLLGCALRLYGFSVATTVWMVLPLQLLHSLTFGAFHTASVTYVSESVPADMQSTAQAVFSAVTIGAGGILGGALGGLVARHLGFKALYFSFGSLAAVALVLLLLTVPRIGSPSRNAAQGSLGPKPN